MFKRKNQQATAATQPEVQTGALRPVDLWVHRDWCNQDVVGESHYLDSIMGIVGDVTAEGREVRTTASLIAEPSNPHDRNAVAVQVSGTTIGYLPREDAPAYQPLLLDLQRRGKVANVPCRVWGSLFTDYDCDSRGHPTETRRFNGTVSVALAEPHLCLPINSPPRTPWVLLPDGNAIQVTGEEHHLPTLAPVVAQQDESLVYATLQLAPKEGIKDRVEVRINDERVGTLTPKMSGELLPAIRAFEEHGLATACKALVRGNQLKAEVTIHCARAHDIPSEWLQSVPANPSSAEPVRRSAHHSDVGAGSSESLNTAATEHPPIPPKPTVRFVPAPGWPAPPDGWEPTPGWKPDPSWPPPPEGWRFWTIN